MRSGLIVVKLPGLKIADEFIIRALETHPTSAGFAAVINGVIENYVFDPKTTDVMDSIIKTQEAYLPDRVFFHFSKADEEGFSKQSEQPFNLLNNDKGELVVSAMVEGDLIEWDVEGEDTPEFNFVDNYLYEKLDGIYQSVGKDLVKFRAEIDKPTFKKDMLGQLRPRGEVLVLLTEGEPINFSENKLGKVFPSWGYASKHLDYVEPEVEKPKEVMEEKPIKALTFAEKKARAKALQDAEAAPGTVTDAPKPDETKPAEGQPGAPVPIILPNGIIIPPTNEFFSMKDGKLWCRVEKGANVSRAKFFWNSNCTLQRPQDEKLLLAGFPAQFLKNESSLKATIEPQTAFRDAMQRGKDNAPKTAGAEIDKTGGSLLVIPVEERKRAMGLMLADAEAHKDDTLEQILDVQKEHPKFTEQTAITLDTICRASVQTYFKLGLKNMVNLANELRLMYLKDHPEVGKKPVEKKAAETAAPAGETRQLTFAEKKAAAKKAA